MVIKNPDGTKKAYCDLCSKELTDKLHAINQGDIYCDDCVKEAVKEIPVNEYLEDF